MDESRRASEKNNPEPRNLTVDSRIESRRQNLMKKKLEAELLKKEIEKSVKLDIYRQ